MTAPTIERSPARTAATEKPTEGDSSLMVGNMYAVMPMRTEFPGFGQGNLWLAQQPAMPDFMDASIKLQDTQSNGLDSIVLPFGGEPMMSPDLTEEFRLSGITVYPVQLAERSLARHRNQWETSKNPPENLIEVTREEVDDLAEKYISEHAKYSIPLSSACGWPTLIAVAGYNKLRKSRQTGTTVVFGAHRELEPTLPPRQFVPRAAAIGGQYFG